MGLFGRKAAPPAPAPAPASTSQPAESLEDAVFNMKFNAKQLGRMSKKSESAVAKEKKKCKEAIQAGNKAGATIHAENAIRNEKQALSYLRLQARLDAVASRLEGHAKMQMVTSEMSNVTQQLGVALGSMNMEEVSRTMDTFEKQFEDLDLQAAYVDSAIGESTSQSTPVDQVNQLMMEVADEHSLDVRHVLDQATVDKYGKSAPSAAQQEAAANDDLMARLAALSAPQ